MAGRFSVDAVFRAIDHFTRPVRGMERALGRLVRGARVGLGQMGSALGGVAQKMATVSRYAMLAGAAAAALITRDVINTGREYEQAITDVGAVMLKTRGEIEALDVKAKQLGATTKFTATESANAMELMAKAGFKQHEVLAGVGGVLSAAAASSMELAETADHVSNVLKGMGLEAMEATRVADVLALASSRTNSTIGSLGESMRNVSSTARQLKVPLEDVVAGVALLQDVGLDASVAGSAMNTMLTKLAKPPAAVAAQMKRMGVAFKDAKGNMLPLREVMANLAKAAKESGGNMDQVAFFADLVGLRGQKAATNLKDLFVSGKFDELAGSLRNAAGAAKEMADIKLDTFTGRWTLLKSKIDAIKTALYETAGGPLEKMLAGLDKWIDKNKYAFLADAPGWVKNMETLAKEFADGFKFAFEPLLKGFEGFWDAISGAGGPSDFTKELFNNLGVLAGALAGALLVVGSILAGVTYGIGVLLLSIKYVAHAIADFIFWLVNDVPAGLGKTWDAIGRMWDAFKDSVGGLVQGFIDGLTGTWDKLISVATGLIGKLWAAIKSALGIASASKIAAELGRGIVAGLVKGLEDGWDALKSAAGKFGRLLWQALKKAFGIASPSRPGTALGKNIGGSVVDGIISQQARIKRAWSDVATGLSATADLSIRVKKPPRDRGRDEMIVPRRFLFGVRPSDLGLPRVGGRDGSARDERDQRGRRAAPQLFTPGERISRSITEILRTEKTEAEVTIRDETGRASVTKAPKGKGIGLKVQPSGAF